MNGESLIRVEDLHKSFGKLNVLNGITDQIHKGEVVTIIGPSGGGKSTFLRCLNLLEVPTSGHVYFEGVDITNKKVDINLHRQKMGMVFQHFNVFPHMTVGKNVMLAPTMLGKKSKAEALEHLELPKAFMQIGYLNQVVGISHLSSVSFPVRRWPSTG